jgi:hypothetical protein
LSVFKYLFLISSVLFLFSCGSKEQQDGLHKQNSGFLWSEKLQLSDIPESTIKGNLHGKEVTFSSVVLEKWHGTNDNVLNFALNKPEQECGFIEKYEGFQILFKKTEIKQGDYLKEKFSDKLDSADAFYKYFNNENNSVKSAEAWNVILRIESLSRDSVKGKIALCFNDESKSWIAGKFGAKICNN